MMQIAMILMETIAPTSGNLRFFISWGLSAVTCKATNTSPYTGMPKQNTTIRIHVGISTICQCQQLLSIYKCLVVQCTRIVIQIWNSTTVFWVLHTYISKTKNLCIIYYSHHQFLCTLVYNKCQFCRFVYNLKSFDEYSIHFTFVTDIHLLYTYTVW